jgi:hypothetical protein
MSAAIPLNSLHTLDEAAEFIIRHAGLVKSQRSNYEFSAQQICDHEIGEGDFTGDRTPGTHRLDVIYDTTALNSGTLLSSALDSLLSSLATKFFTLRPRNRTLLEDESTRRWLEQVENVIFHYLARPEARFTNQMSELYHNLVFFGMGAMFIEDEPGAGVFFSARPLQEIYITENAAGVVNTVLRRFKLTAMQAVGIWGDAVPSANKLAADGEHTSETEYLHFVRRTGSIEDHNSSATSLPWASTYVSLADQRVVDQGGFRANPYVTPRWSVRAGEVYGVGPGFRALPLAKGLNEIVKTMLEHGQMSIHPPRMVDAQRIEGAPDMYPGALIHKRPGTSGEPAIEPVPLGGDLNFGISLLEDQRTQMRSTMHFELLQIIQDPRMTAFQVSELSSTMQRLLSPFLGRMETELLSPTVNRTYDIALEQGAIPPPPPEFEDADFDVEYRSPISISQKKLQSQGIINSLTAAGNLAQIAPQVMDNFDMDKSIRFIHEAEGAPLEVLMPADTMEKIREAQAQQEAEEAQRQQQLEAVDAAGGVEPLANVAGMQGLQ